MGLTVASKVFVTNKFELKFDFIYRPSFVLYLKKESSFFMFGKIKEIYVVNEEPFLLLDMYLSKELDIILNSYEITSQNISKILNFKEVEHLRPYEYYVINLKKYLLTPDVLEP